MKSSLSATFIALVLVSACYAYAGISLPDFAKKPAATVTVPAAAGDATKAIQSAINSLSRSGGNVALGAGVFTISDSITLRSNVYLSGRGKLLTTINSTVKNKGIFIREPGAVVGNLGITGHAFIWVGRSDVLVHDVEAKNLFLDQDPGGEEHAAFMIAGWNDPDIRNVSFINCRAEKVSTHGFSVAGWMEGPQGSNSRATDISFIGCEAVSCGGHRPSAHKSNWGVGFDLQEQIHVENLLVKDCRALDNWEAGFYQEPNYDKVIFQTKGLVIEDSYAEGNGNRKEAAVGLSTRYNLEGTGKALQHGAGFIIHNNATIKNCVSSGNAIAGFTSWGANFSVAGGKVTYKDCRALKEKRAGFANMYGTYEQGIEMLNCSVDGRGVNTGDLVNTYRKY